jgi:hypothetical protein
MPVRVGSGYCIPSLLNAASLVHNPTSQHLQIYAEAIDRVEGEDCYALAVAIVPVADESM